MPSSKPGGRSGHNQPGSGRSSSGQPDKTNIGNSSGSRGSNAMDEGKQGRASQKGGRNSHHGRGNSSRNSPTRLSSDDGSSGDE